MASKDDITAQMVDDIAQGQDQMAKTEVFSAARFKPVESIQWVAAFRTYTWTESIASLARRFFSHCENARHVILADETRGSLGIDDTFEVISHTSDNSSLGLMVAPQGNSLWFNVDYGIYILRHALPGFDYYVFSESDLAVNADILPIVEQAAERNIDFIAHDIRPSTPDWYWHRNGVAAFATPYRSLLFFMIVSPRAADRLFESRLKLAEDFLGGELDDWTFCEPFVPSALLAASMRIGNISEFVDTADLNFRPRISLEDPRANRPGALVHSVLGKQSYTEAMVTDFPPRDWFRASSEMRSRLADQDFAEYMPILKAVFERTNDHSALVLFSKEMSSRGYATPMTDDLAFCKPALVSSTSIWSRFSDPQMEAGCANGINSYDDYAFHTAHERQPWWMVDLLNGYLIDEIRILNRETFSERFTVFSLQSSLDSITWTTRFSKFDLSPISADPEAPYSILFSDPFYGRYLRIVLAEPGVLHLRRVNVFGRIVLDRDAQP